MAKLGQLLVARGWITVQQLTRALKNQNVAGGRLGTCLLEMDALSEDLLLKGLSEQLGVSAAEMDDLRNVPEEVRELIPQKLARRLHAIPFHVESGRLDVALLDPRNLAAQDELAFASGKRVKIYVAPEIRILEALDRYYGEECPSRLSRIAERLNRARFMWDKPPAAASPAEMFPTQPMQPMLDPLAPPLKLNLPPALPEMASAPPQRPRPAAPAAAAVAATALAPQPRPAPPPPPPAAAAVAAAVQPAPTPAPARLPRQSSVSLTPEERAELGAFSWVAPAATDHSIPVPSSLEEAEALLAKASELDQVGEVLLGFLGSSHRRAALFQVSRDRVQGWRIYGTGIDRDAFAAFSIGFDQPSIFLNLRQGSGLYLGPLPPMPAHRQLARTWGGDLPRDCMLLPVRIKDRLVIVIYADGYAKGAIDLPVMQRLAAAATTAVERCILQRKRSEAKP